MNPNEIRTPVETTQIIENTDGTYSVKIGQVNGGPFKTKEEADLFVKGYKKRNFTN